MKKGMFSLVIVFYMFTLITNAVNVINFDVKKTDDKVIIYNSSIGDNIKVAKLVFNNLTYLDNQLDNVEVYEDILVIYGNVQETMDKLEFKIIDKNKNAELKLGVYEDNLRIVKTNGETHYYQFIEGGYFFNEAIADAETRTLDGLKGYLATITDEFEQTLLNKLSDVEAWAGGSCGVYVDGKYIYSAETCENPDNRVYRWISGPEYNQEFYPSGQFNFFGELEPNNNELKEAFLLVNYFDNGGWNDIDDGEYGYYLEFSEYGSQQIDEANYIIKNIEPDNPILTPTPTSVVITPVVPTHTPTPVTVAEPFVSPTPVSTVKPVSTPEIKKVVIKDEKVEPVEVEENKAASITLVSNINESSTAKNTDNGLMATSSANSASIISILSNLDMVGYTILTVFGAVIVSLIYQVVKYIAVVYKLKK